MFVKKLQLKCEHKGREFFLNMFSDSNILGFMDISFPSYQPGEKKKCQTGK